MTTLRKPPGYWTPDRDEELIARFKARRYRIKTVARDMGLTPGAVTSRLHKIGASPRRRTPVTSATAAEAVR